MTYYLDTDVVSYYLKGKGNLIFQKMYETDPIQIKIPAIVHSELLYGYRNSLSKKVEKVLFPFLGEYEIIPFTEDCSRQYAEIRNQLTKEGSIIGNNDILIAAIVMTNNGTLVTHNTKEFSRVSGLKIEDWI